MKSRLRREQSRIASLLGVTEKDIRDEGFANCELYILHYVRDIGTRKIDFTAYGFKKHR